MDRGMTGSPSLRTPSPKRKSPKKAPRAPKKSVRKSSRKKAVKKSSKKSSGKFPANRKAPLLHARDQKVGTTAKGADGNQWIVKKISNGSKRWSKVSGKMPVRWIGEGRTVTALMKREAKHGDLYEDIGESGERTWGLYGVSTTGGKVHIIDLSDLSEWGSPPFKAGVEFPLNYWDTDVGRNAETGEPAQGYAHWYDAVVEIDLKAAKGLTFSAPVRISSRNEMNSKQRTIKFSLGGKRWSIIVYAHFENGEDYLVPNIWNMTSKQLENMTIAVTPTGPYSGFVGYEEY